jgi:hypothetical protein
VCANGHPFTIVMPPETLEAQIVAAVSERSHEADRSWYPRDHPTAILFGQPHGQTVQDLLDENRVVRKHWDAVASQKDDLLRQLLADRGVTVRADGTLEGNL